MAKLPLAVGRAWRLELLRLLVGATALTAVLTLLASTPREALDASLAVFGIVLVALPYMLWRAGRRIRRHWNAFELAVGTETVRIAAKGGGRVTIKHDEIAAVVERASGLDVSSVVPGVAIHVPRLVESYPDVRARLATLRPIAVRPEALGWSVALVLAGLVVSAAITFPQVPGGLALGLMLCQMAVALVVAGDIRGNPILSSGKRALGVVVAVGAALLPVGAVFLR